MTEGLRDLERLLDWGVVEELDYHFARTLNDLVEEPLADEVLLAAGLVSRAVHGGHVCLDLNRLNDTVLLDRDGSPVPLKLPRKKRWAEILEACPVIGDGRLEAPTPLVFEAHAMRLYLNRYWAYQQRLQASLQERSLRWAEFDGPVLKEGLKRYFEGGPATEDFQRLGALVAVMRNFCVISGGPGTGKTTTVVRILALLLEQAQAMGRRMPRMMLLAPTGKAAARLAESIQTQKEKLPLDDELKMHIPEEGMTLHRALGWRKDRPTRFVHHAENPLLTDVVLVDEASMVDIGLLAKLIDAVPKHARLILLGDKDQLASVEAGAILGDICNAPKGYVANHLSQSFAELVASEVGEPVLAGSVKDTGIWDSIVQLTKSWRFQGGIARLAKPVQQGKGKKALEILRGDDQRPEQMSLEGRDLHLVTLDHRDRLNRELDRFILTYFATFQTCQDPEEALALYSRARLLCAHRRGPMGVEYMNDRVEQLLAERKLINPRDPFYIGRPVMVIRNDYQFELFNGDIGLVLRDNKRGKPMVFFPGRKLPIAPGQLPLHETVYAMTVHKSQGSEFEHVALMLPPEQSPILTRELIYTGLTRAKASVTFFTDETVFVEGIKKHVNRASGLSDGLWRKQLNLGSAGKTIPVDEPESSDDQLSLFD